MLHRSTVCALVVLSSAASAQCLDWTRAYPPPGIVDGPAPFFTPGVVEALVVDDTNGPASLILAGTFYGADSVISTNAVRWDGTQYHALPGISSDVLGLWRIDLGSGPVIYAGTRTNGPTSLFRLVNDAWVPLPGPPRAVKDLVAFDSGFGLELHAASGIQSGGQGQIYRLSASGWVQLSGFLNLPVEALAVFDDGAGPALYAAGNFTWQLTPTAVMVRGIGRWSNGSWVEVGGGLTRANLDPASPRALVVHDFGAGPRLVVGGFFDNAGNQNIPYLAAWDGATWSDVVAGLNAAVLDMDSVVLASGPKLAVSGNFTAGTNGPARSPILVDGTGVTELGPTFAGQSDSELSVRAFAGHDDGHGLSLFIGGQFDTAGTHPAADVARWDETNWYALTAPDGVVGDVLALERHDDGSGPALYAAGELKAVGGVLHHGVGRFDGSAWTPVGSSTTTPYPRIHELTSTDVGEGRRLYAGGQYASIGGVAAVAVASWDGTVWAPLAGGDLAGTAPVVLAMATFDDGTGPALYLGGGFEHAGPIQNVNNVARWTPTGGWSSVAGGMPSVFDGVDALAVFDDGSGARLFAAASGRVRRLDGATWQELPGPAQMPGQIYALAAYEFGAERLLFVGGQYQSIGGAGTLNIAAWTGSSWRTFGQGATGAVNGSVRAFHLYDDGQGGLPKLAAVGRFAQIDGAQGAAAAIWDGASWQSPEGGGVNGTAMSVASLDDGDGPSLFLGGFFTTTNTSIAVGFARYGWIDDPSCTPITGSSFCDGSGSGAACPCGNAGLALHGCGNSANANGARLRARGAANATDDTVTLELSGTTPNAPALYFQGTSAIASGAGSVFGDGVRCAGGSVRRLGVRQSVAGTSSFGAAAGTALVSDAGAVEGATTRYYQAWYRDPNAGFCTSATFNLSNGVAIQWAP